MKMQKCAVPLDTYDEKSYLKLPQISTTLWFVVILSDDYTDIGLTSVLNVYMLLKVKLKLYEID